MEKQVMLQGYPIEVGDRVWHRTYGWQTVISIDDSSYRPIAVGDIGAFYREDGKYSENDCFPEIFWQPVEIIPPPKPKKMVKRQVVIEGVRWSEQDYSIFPHADTMRHKWYSLRNKPPMKMTLEWDEEE